MILREIKHWTTPTWISSSKFKFIYLYRYTKFDSTNPNGNLIFLSAVKAEDLKIASGTLNLTDISVLGDRIFALDNTQGLYSFTYSDTFKTPSDLIVWDLNKTLGI